MSKLKFKPGDVIYGFSGGLDICEIISINQNVQYKMRQVNNHPSYPIGSIFDMSSISVDDYYELITDELKAKFL